MSSDRLRAAADRLRAAADWWEGTGEFPTGPRAHAIAALLRAVADNHEPIRQDQPWCRWCVESWPCREVAVALALADAVLGGTDE